MDLFQVVRELSCVKKASNLPYNYPQPLNLLLFLCPALKGSGIKVNRYRTGLTGKYKEGVSTSIEKRLQRAKELQKELVENKIKFYTTAIYATADAFILFSPPSGKISVPDNLSGIKVVSNYELFFNHLSLWNKFYKEKPWENLPQRFVKEGKNRLLELLPTKCPENIREDFLDRNFAGFVLDGFLIKKGYFGKNSVILGVESPEIAVFQNTLFQRKERIPVIQLF